MGHFRFKIARETPMLGIMRPVHLNDLANRAGKEIIGNIQMGPPFARCTAYPRIAKEKGRPVSRAAFEYV